MVLRITRGRFDPAKYDDVVPLARQVEAAAEGLPGYRNVQTAIDRSGGKIVAVSPWDTMEQATFSREQAPVLGDVVRRMMAIGVEFDPPEIYEIVS